MSDPRLTLRCGDVADARLEGVVEAARYEVTRPMRCIATSAAIRKAADAASEQQDQLVFGEAFDVLEAEGDFAFGQARRDGYVGWVEASALTEGALSPTHWVSARSTLAFTKPDLKSPPAMALTMNSLAVVDGREGRFAHVEGAGWVPEAHISPIAEYQDDPAAVALRFRGAPYFWGGRESVGLDCSGLVQQAHYACGLPSARDTDMQASLGAPVEASALRRGDLVFWKGHVGMMADGETLLHANAHHMATEGEPLSAAIERVAAAGAGQPVGFRRV